ncbi:MAG: hypothetical protein ACQEXQ_00140 [Bacillota bacterium]
MNMKIMMKRIKKATFVTFGLMIVMVVGLMICNMLAEPAITRNDISVQAVIKANETNGASGKYEFDVHITKEKAGYSRLYIYNGGYSHTNIYESQNNVSMRPPKRDSESDRLAGELLGSAELSYFGEPQIVVIPKASGKYWFKLFYHDYIGTRPHNDIRAVLVHKRQLLWKDFSWAEEIEVAVRLSL